MLKDLTYLKSVLPNSGRQHRFRRILRPDVDGTVRNLGLLLSVGHSLCLLDGEAVSLSPSRKFESLHGEGTQEVDQRGPRV